MRCKIIISLLSLALLVSSCEEKLEPVNAKRMINNVSIERSELCDNELALLTSKDNNWKIEVDSIRTMTHFRTIQKQVIANYFTSEEGLANTDDRHPRIFPYMTINDVDVSMMRFLMPTSGGYRMAAEELKWIRYRSEEAYENSSCEKKVFNFYNNYEPKKKKPGYDPMAIDGPVVNLTVEDDGFRKSATMLEDVAEGYIVAMKADAVEKFNKELCDLEPNELAKIQNAKPFKVRLFKDKARRAN